MNVFQGIIDVLKREQGQDVVGGIDPGNTDAIDQIVSQNEPAASFDAPPEPTMIDVPSNGGFSSQQNEMSPNVQALQQYISPDALAKVREQASAKTPLAANIMQFFPRLQGAANSMRGAHANRVSGAQADLANRMKMAAEMERLGFDKDKFSQEHDLNLDKFELNKRDKDFEFAYDESDEALEFMKARYLAEYPHFGQGRLGEAIKNVPSMGMMRNLLNKTNKFDEYQKDWREKKLSDDTTRRGQDIDYRKTIDSKKLGEGGLELTPGQKKLDETFAKEYSEWNAAGGFAATMKDIEKLKNDVLDNLDPENQRGDQLSGVLEKTPLVGQALFPKEKAITQNLESVVMKSLKKILGGQFSEKEGQKLIEAAYDEQLSDAENYKRVKNLVEQLETMAKAKEASSKYFEKHGTLKGYKASDGQSSQFKENITKTINGTTYRKVEGGWESVE